MAVVNVHAKWGVYCPKCRTRAGEDLEHDHRGTWIRYVCRDCGWNTGHGYQPAVIPPRLSIVKPLLFSTFAFFVRG